MTKHTHDALDRRHLFPVAGPTHSRPETPLSKRFSVAGPAEIRQLEPREEAR